VRKPVLGKGLATLLPGGSGGERAEGSASFTGSGHNGVGPGLKRLFRGDPGSVPSNGRVTAEQPRVTGPPGVSLKWVLVGADLLLMILVCLLVANTPRPLRVLEWTLCFLALGLGAAMAILALTQTPGPSAGKSGNRTDETTPQINGHIKGDLPHVASRPNSSTVEKL
jgi:hypothetical protein